jgi:hypothetical protein
MAVTLREARIAQDERARAERRFNDARNLANALLFEVHDSIRDLSGATGAKKAEVPANIQKALERCDRLIAARPR